MQKPTNELGSLLPLTFRQSKIARFSLSNKLQTENIGTQCVREASQPVSQSVSQSDKQTMHVVFI